MTSTIHVQCKTHLSNISILANQIAADYRFSLTPLSTIDFLMIPEQWILNLWLSIKKKPFYLWQDKILQNQSPVSYLEFWMVSVSGTLTSKSDFLQENIDAMHQYARELSHINYYFLYLTICFLIYCWDKRRVWQYKISDWYMNINISGWTFYILKQSVTIRGFFASNHTFFICPNID